MNISKEKDNTKLLLLIGAAAILLELLISNFTLLPMLFNAGDKKVIDLKSRFGTETVEIGARPLVIGGVDAEMKNVRLTLSAEYITFTEVEVAFTDDNFRFEDGYEYNRAKVFVEAGEKTPNVIDLSSYGKVGSIRLSSDERVTLSEIAVNVIPPFTFRLIRCLFIYLIICCVVFGLWEIPLESGNRKYIKVCAACVCLAVVIVTGMMYSMSAQELLVDINDDVTKSDEYIQLFDAFRSGRLDLDIDYDTAELDKLSNPYDRSERNENDIHGAFWDRAYYNGKFYSYFGAAPVFTVYYPVYILTGKAASQLLASSISCIYCVIFISLLYGLFLRRFCRDVPLLLAILGQLSLLFSSAVFAIAAENMFYFIAVLSGIAWTAAFFYFLLTAYYSKSQRKRVILLVLTGISVALIAASRPTMLLYCFVGLIPAVYIFKDKKETVRRKLIYTVSAGVPIVIGAGLLMAYNYARFGSPFEFGFNYQLTVSRAQANTIKLSMLPPALYHYFFQQPKLISSFPYIRIRENSLGSYTRYSYAGKTMGIFTYPISWGIALMPFVLAKRNTFRARLLAAVTAAAVMMSFIDMCKAGSHYRYTADIAFMFMLVSLTMIFNEGGHIKKRSCRRYKLYTAAVATAMTISIIIGALLIFANESGYMLDKCPEVTSLLRLL